MSINVEDWVSDKHGDDDNVAATHQQPLLQHLDSYGGQLVEHDGQDGGSSEGSHSGSESEGMRIGHISAERLNAFLDAFLGIIATATIARLT